MILRAYEILEEQPHPTALEVRELITGNLCRCTGYQFIIDAVLDAAERMSPSSSADRAELEGEAAAVAAAGEA
jgi:carbon-monoxide dehydrogenase small subunit